MELMSSLTQSTIGSTAAVPDQERLSHSECFVLASEDDLMML